MPSNHCTLDISQCSPNLILSYPVQIGHIRHSYDNRIRHQPTLSPMISSTLSYRLPIRRSDLDPRVKE
jgi:hypothetical protein